MWSQSSTHSINRNPMSTLRSPMCCMTIQFVCWHCCLTLLSPFLHHATCMCAWCTSAPCMPICLILGMIYQPAKSPAKVFLYHRIWQIHINYHKEFSLNSRWAQRCEKGNSSIRTLVADKKAHENWEIVIVLLFIHEQCGIHNVNRLSGPHAPVKALRLQCNSRLQSWWLILKRSSHVNPL